MHLDTQNDNHLWEEAERLETSQLNDYDLFEDLGFNAEMPDGCTKIPAHFVYDVKHDGRRKARFVAGGHRTETPADDKCILTPGEPVPYIGKGRAW